jgi:hypothetical protein
MYRNSEHTIALWIGSGLVGKTRKYTVCSIRSRVAALEGRVDPSAVAWLYLFLDLLLPFSVRANSSALRSMKQSALRIIRPFDALVYHRLNGTIRMA